MKRKTLLVFAIGFLCLCGCTSIKDTLYYSKLASERDFSYFFPSPNFTRYFATLDDAYDYIRTAQAAPVASVPVQPQPMPTNMVQINGGIFSMGSPADEPGRTANEIQRRVTISTFYMGRYPVTQAEYQTVMGTNPSNFKGSNLPVENVSWFDAVEYCNRLSQRKGLTPAYTVNGTSVTWNRSANGYRLPTEAEWEYACRAGTVSAFYTGNNVTTDQANYNGNSPYNRNARGTFREKTTNVGNFAPNTWGLSDMLGNVWEWCWDWYGNYSEGAQTDPEGSGYGTGRVRRGGAWNSSGGSLRSACRSFASPSLRSNDLGFRIVRN